MYLPSQSSSGLFRVLVKAHKKLWVYTCLELSGQWLKTQAWYPQKSSLCLIAKQFKYFPLPEKNEFLLIFMLSRASFGKMIYMYGWGTAHFSTTTIGSQWKMRTATHCTAHTGHCLGFLYLAFFVTVNLKLPHQKCLYLPHSIRSF